MDYSDYFDDARFDAPAFEEVSLYLQDQYPASYEKFHSKEWKVMTWKIIRYIANSGDSLPNAVNKF